MNNKVIIITGASSGIGAALAKKLAAQGAKVALAARSLEKLNEIAGECPGSIPIPTDVTDPTACRELIEKTVAYFGRLDVLVNNAGISMRARFEDIDDLSIFEKMLQVNYLGCVYTTHAALPYLKVSQGQIVAISSLAGKTGMPFRTGYAASKHALQGFMDALRIELMDTGVAVTVISPGFVDTDRAGVLGSDGQPLGVDSKERQGVMSVDEATTQIIKAIEARRRELLMGTKGKLLMIGKLIAPRIVDNMARKSAGWNSEKKSSS